MEKITRYFSITVVFAFLVVLIGCGGGGSLEVTPTDIAGNNDNQSTVTTVPAEKLQALTELIPNVTKVEDDILSIMPDVPSSAPVRKASIADAEGNYFYFTVNPNYTYEYDSTNGYDIYTYKFMLMWLDKPYGNPEARVIQGREYYGSIKYTLEYDYDIGDYVLVPATRYVPNPGITYDTAGTYVYGYVKDPLLNYQIEGADIIIAMEGYQHGIVKTDSKGYFAVPVFTETGTTYDYVVTVMREGYEPYTTTFTDLESHANLGTVLLQPKAIIGNTVKGRVYVDDYYEGATVYLCAYDEDTYDADPSFTPIVAKAVATDENGYFTLTHIPPGHYCVCVIVKGKVTNYPGSDDVDFTTNTEIETTIDVGTIYADYPTTDPTY